MYSRPNFIRGSFSAIQSEKRRMKSRKFWVFTHHSLLIPPHSNQAPAAHVEDLPGDIAGLVRGKVGARLSDFFRFADAAHRNLAGETSYLLLRQIDQDRGVHQTWRN